MSVLVMECPHCGAGNTTFNAISEVLGEPHSQNIFRWIVLQCPVCFGVVTANVEANANRNGNPLHSIQGLLSSQCRIRATYPAPRPINIPMYLPENVAKAFKDGCECVKRQPTLACTGFRRALELGLKQLAPEIEAWKLEKRIDKLADQHLITPDIKEWAHQIRLDGNAGVHDDDERTVEQAEEMESLTRFVLTYIYTLPKQVEEARTKK